MWRNLAEKGIKVLSEAAEVAVHLSVNPTPIGLIAVGARVLNTINNMTSPKPEDFFSTWSHLNTVHPLGDFLHSLCKSSGLLIDEFPGVESKFRGKIVTGSLGTIKIGWVEHDTWHEGPYIAPGMDPIKATNALRELIWVVMGKVVKFYVSPISFPVLLNDSLDETLPSETGDTIWEKQKLFIDRGYRRALLLHGEPGVGKSHIARYLTDKAGGKRLRIRARDLEHLRSLGALISFLQPNGVIIDDLDRAKTSTGIIEEFDEIRSKASLFIVTANFIKKLDPAIFRRFDAEEHISKLDNGVIDRLLSGIDPDIAKKLRSMPIHYIARYREAHEVLGTEEAEKELDRLIDQDQRVKQMCQGFVPKES